MKEIKFEFSVPAFLGTAKTKIWARGAMSAVWIALTFFIGTNYNFSFVEMLIFAYFGFSLIWKLSSRISAGLALFFLVITPFLLMLKNDTLAETCAIYAYYFLVITVVQAVFELKKAKKTPVDNFAGRPGRKIV